MCLTLIMSRWYQTWETRTVSALVKWMCAVLQIVRFLWWLTVYLWILKFTRPVTIGFTVSLVSTSYSWKSTEELVRINSWLTLGPISSDDNFNWLTVAQAGSAIDSTFRNCMRDRGLLGQESCWMNVGPLLDLMLKRGNLRILRNKGVGWKPPILLPNKTETIYCRTGYSSADMLSSRFSRLTSNPALGTESWSL